MDIHTRLKVLDRLIRILAAEQLELPIVRDVPRDPTKAKIKNLYEALDDPEHSGLSEEELLDLQEAKDEHIERVKIAIKHANDRVAQWTNEALESWDSYYDLQEDMHRVRDVLMAYGDKHRLSALENAAEELDSDILFDMLNPHVEYLEYSKSNLVLSDYEHSEDVSYYFDKVVEQANGLDVDTLNEILDDTDTSGFEQIEVINNRGVLLISAMSASTTLYIGVSRSNIPELVEILDQALTEIRDLRGGPSTEHLSKKVMKQLPPGASADQLALLREFDLRGMDKIPSQEFRKLSWANTPWIKSLLDQHKYLTPKIVSDSIPKQPSSALDTLHRYQTLDVKTFTMDIQVIWKKPNYAFVVGLPLDHLNEVLPTKGNELGDIRTFAKKNQHPKIDQTTLTVGWVRFTEFDQDVWIDEIQTDLFHLSDNITTLAQTHLGGMTAVLRYVVEQFIREMRARGYQKFYLPNLDIKENNYYADPPESVYTDLPKKLRFKPIELTETPFSPQIISWPRLPEDSKIWVLSSTKAQTLDALAHNIMADSFDSEQYLVNQVLPLITDDQFASVIGLHGFVLVDDLALDHKTLTLEGVVRHPELGAELQLLFGGSYIRPHDGEWSIVLKGTKSDLIATEHQQFTHDPKTDATKLMRGLDGMLGNFVLLSKQTQV